MMDGDKFDVGNLDIWPTEKSSGNGWPNDHRRGISFHDLACFSALSWRMEADRDCQSTINPLEIFRLSLHHSNLVLPAVCSIPDLRRL